MYWVDDSNSKYYNKLVELIPDNIFKNVKLPYTQISLKEMDWNTAEHLYSYPRQYSYAIEIKYNENCIKEKGSAIFLHSSIQKNTAGCITIQEKYLKRILIRLKLNTKIYIGKI